MEKLAKHLHWSLSYCRSSLYWWGRSIKARVHCWYISKIWLPLHQTPELTEVERQEAAAVINDILEEIKTEEKIQNV